MEEVPKNSTLELTLLSCSSLKAFNFFRKLSLYAAVSLISDTGRCISGDRYKTETDKVRGCNPEWNHSFSLDIARALSTEQQLEEVFVKFEVCCQGGSVLWNRKVGEVQVSLKTLVNEFNGVDRFLRYHVDGQSGNAAFNFSYKLKGIITPSYGGGSRLRYFSSFGTQFSVDAGIFSPVPYRQNSYTCRGGTVAAEIDEDDVSESPSGLQLTGYNSYQYNRWAVNNTRL